MCFLILLVMVNSKGGRGCRFGSAQMSKCCPVAILILCEASLAMGGRVSVKEATQLWVVGGRGPTWGAAGSQQSRDGGEGAVQG